MTWNVGASEVVRRRWKIGSAEVSTGTATVKFVVTVSGSPKYLQSDNTLASTPVQTYPLTFTSGVGWQYFFTVPISLVNYNVVAEVTHSDNSLPMLPEEHLVIFVNNSTPGATVR